MAELIIKNPLTEILRNSIINCNERLYFAVPFFSSFAITLLDKDSTFQILDKRIITRFDDSSLASFDLPTLQTLLGLGFKIQFDNSIHLKLYITDDESYVTSSNLTRAGFENNVELTVKTDLKNTQNCIDIFNEIWVNCSENILCTNLIKENWGKYEILCKREKYVKKEFGSQKASPIKVNGIGYQKIIYEIFNQNIDYSHLNSLAFEANRLREKSKEKLKKKFDHLIFYAPKDHALRRSTLFYDFVYGYEVKLASTGLRDKQFKSVFLHSDFEKVINYFLPENLGLNPWNLSDQDEFQEFCNGIFDFEIPQYSEAIPIRLASYFYPEYFIPIFRLDHLKVVCEALGLTTSTYTKGDKLFIYNSFLSNKMKALPFNNYIKSNISYRILFTIELYTRLIEGESYEDIFVSYKESWKRDLIESGKELLTRMKVS